MNAPRTNEMTFLLKGLFDAAVAVAQPDVCLPPFLPEAPKGRTIVVGAGKASAAMAKALERHWPTKVQGTVVTRYGHAVGCADIEIVEAAHPVPDENSERAAQKILAAVQNLTEDDLVICLISGGGSSLMSLAIDGISLQDKQMVNQALLRSGATISEMNVVRKHLSAIKGGRLGAAAFPARVVSLLISDVPGDDPAIIASGPTVPDPSTFEQARAVIKQYGIQLPDAVSQLFDAAINETPKPGDPRLHRSSVHLIATPQQSLEAAASIGRQAGYEVVIMSDRLEGESSAVAQQHVEWVKQVLDGVGPVKPPCILLSGGETTVKVTGAGRGGRNAQFGLAFAKAMNGAAGVYGIFCDTDGIDGTENNAGVMVTPETLSLAQAQGMNPNDYLANNDAFSFFTALNALVVTGPTLTNVNDFRAIVITATTS